MMRSRFTLVALAMIVIAVVAVNSASPVSFPLRISSDRVHLEDSAGSPFLVVGDTAWSLIAQLRSVDVERYLDDRAGRGFNAIIVNLLEHKFASHAPANLRGVRPFLDDSWFGQPNPEYFDEAYRVIDAARQRGLSVWLCPAYLGWDGGDEGFYKDIAAAGQDALKNYGRFVGERFRDLPNIVWMLGGDYAFPSSHRWLGDALAAGLREGGAKQLMTAHGGQTAAVETFGDREWLAIDTVYSYLADLRGPLGAARQRRPQRPFVLIETTYEGEHDSRPGQIRFQAWAAMLSGAAGQFFGNNPIWHFDGPTLFKYEGTWQTALDSTGSRDMARLGRFFRAQDWPALRPMPDGTIAASDSGAPPIAATIADTGRTIVYVPAGEGGSRELRLELRFMSAQWIDPATNTAPREAAFDRSAESPRLLRTPGRNGAGDTDWVLLLR
jgi:hypothetical protein